MPRRFPLLTCLLAVSGGFLLLANSAREADSEFTCLSERRAWLYENLLEQVTAQSATRQQAVQQALASAADVEARREQLRGKLAKLIGPLPERTPLNARTVGTIECEGPPTAPAIRASASLAPKSARATSRILRQA